MIDRSPAAFAAVLVNRFEAIGSKLAVSRQQRTVAWMVDVRLHRGPCQCARSGPLAMQSALARVTSSSSPGNDQPLRAGLGGLRAIDLQTHGCVDVVQVAVCHSLGGIFERGH
jgi:hypothetical protein